MFDSQFGSKIKELRKSCDLSQKEVAAQLKVTPTQISDIENGKTAPSFQRAIMLASFFNTSLDYLAGISEKSSSSEIEILFNSLSHDQQMRVLGYIELLIVDTPHS